MGAPGQQACHHRPGRVGLTATTVISVPGRDEPGRAVDMIETRRLAVASGLLPYRETMYYVGVIASKDPVHWRSTTDMLNLRD